MRSLACWPCCGEPVGYIIELENGFKIYHMGDTGLFGDMKLIADYYKPDLVMIPIGGHFVMSPKDAAFATNHWLKPKYAIPMHYGHEPVSQGHAGGIHQGAGQDEDEGISHQSGRQAHFLGTRRTLVRQVPWMCAVNESEGVGCAMQLRRRRDAA